MADQPTPPPGIGDFSTLGIPGLNLVSIFALLRLLATPPDPPPALAFKAEAFEDPVAAFKFTVSGTYQVLVDYGCTPALAHLIAWLSGGVVLIGGAFGFIILWLAKNVLPKIAIAGLEFVDAFRKDLDPVIPRVSVVVLNELLGGNLTAGCLTPAQTFPECTMKVPR